MKISLTPELEKIVRRRVETGRNPSDFDVVDQAVRLLDKLDNLDPDLLIDRETVKAEIQKGIDQLDRGEGIRVTDRAAYIDDILRRSAERKERRNAARA